MNMTLQQIQSEIEKLQSEVCAQFVMVDGKPLFRQTGFNVAAAVAEVNKLIERREQAYLRALEE